MRAVLARMSRAVIAVALAGLVQAFVPHSGQGVRSASSSWTATRARAATGRSCGRRPGGALQMHKVTIEHEGKTHELEVAGRMTILEAALDEGISLPHDCKLGVCLTCPSMVVSGEVDQSEGTLDAAVVEKGYALTCCSYPTTDVVIRSIEEDALVGAQFSDRS